MEFSNIVSRATLDDTLSTAQCISQMYRKSLRLTSKQIVRDVSCNSLRKEFMKKN